jgi:hypothetical protein
MRVMVHELDATMAMEWSKFWHTNRRHCWAAASFLTWVALIVMAFAP